MDTNKLTLCPQLLKEYLFYIETIKGRSAKTVDAYFRDLVLFFKYMKCTKEKINFDEIKYISINDLDNKFICSLTLIDVYEYMNYVMTERENSNRTRARKISSIRSFYEYLNTKTNYLEVNPMSNLEVPAQKKSMPKYLSLEECINLLNSIDTPFSERDFCIITLFINCGMRISELVGINVNDIKDNKLKLLGKGNKERIIYINKACDDAIASYLSVRVAPTDENNKYALFLSRNGKRLTVRRVEQIVDECLKKAGLSGKGYSPHKLRHTAATLMYQYGNVDIRILKEVLGHANIGTTEIYTHISNNQVESAMNKSPLSSFKKNNEKEQV